MLNKLKPTIAIIDSGIGGVSVLNQILDKLKSGNYIYFADNLYMPYGKRTKEFVKKRIDNVIKMLNEKYKTDLIIIACNTASSSINFNIYDNVLTLSFDKDKTYLATELTKKNKPNLNIITDKTLARSVEKYILEPNKLEAIIKRHIKNYNLNNVKTLVLGCTHYELVEDLFKKYCDTKIVKNSEFLVKHLCFDTQSNDTNVLFLQSKNSKLYQEKFFKLIRR